MVRKENVVIKEGLRDGKGIIEIHHFLTEEELMGHGKMYARLVMKPHSSVSYTHLIHMPSVTDLLWNTVQESI